MRRSVLVPVAIAAPRSYEAVEIFLRSRLCRLNLYQHLSSLDEQRANCRYLFVVQRKAPFVTVKTLLCGGHCVPFYLAA
jgi:hypothetical protein